MKDLPVKNFPKLKYAKYMWSKKTHRIRATTDLYEWARWMETADRHVRKTKVGGRWVVSTVFLGLDHNFMGSGGPILFESMVFGTEGSLDQRRYRTEKQAVKGHEALVSKFQKKVVDQK